MATTRTASKRVPWRPEQVKLLRKMAPTRPVGLIAHELGRTESAVRSKAQQEGISFASPERSPYGKPATSRGKRGKTSRARPSRPASRTRR
jgi:hypothetical protein